MAFVISSSSKFEYEKGKFDNPPDKVPEGNPDPRVTIELGGWTADNVMQFKVVQQALSDAQVTVNASAVDSLDVYVGKSERRGEAETYFQVMTGSDSKGTQWEIDFDVFNKDVSPDTEYTGKWKFTKARNEEDLYV